MLNAKMKRYNGRQNLLEATKHERLNTFGMLDTVLKMLFKRDDAQQRFLKVYHFSDVTQTACKNVASAISGVKRFFTLNYCLNVTNEVDFVPRYFGSDISSANDHVGVEYSEGRHSDDQHLQINVIINKLADFNRKNSINYSFHIDDAQQSKGDACTIQLLSSETFEVESDARKGRDQVYVAEDAVIPDINWQNALDATPRLRQEPGSARLTKRSSQQLNPVDLDFGDIMVSRNSRTLTDIQKFDIHRPENESLELDFAIGSQLRDDALNGMFDDFTLTFASTIKQQEKEQQDKKGHYNIKRSGRK